MLRIAIVVPEFQTEFSIGGGLESVAWFVHDALESTPDFMAEFVSVRMASSAVESRRLLNARSWLNSQQIKRVTHKGTIIWYAGARLAEFEPARYIATRRLRRLLRGFDAVIVIGGSPIAFNLVSGIDVPKLGQTATLLRHERPAVLKNLSLFRRMYGFALLPIVSLLERRGMTAVDIVLVENGPMLEHCRTHGAKIVELLEPAIRRDFFTRQSLPIRDRGMGEGGFILSVSRLNDSRKNISSLIRAYGHAVSRYGILERLVLAGLHDVTDEDRNLIRKLGLIDRIEIHQSPSNEELVALYESASLFVLASLEEGLGLVFLEAMAMRVPVIATATVGATHALDHGRVGRLVPLTSDLPKVLGSEIANLLNNPEQLEALTERGYRWVHENFHPDTQGVRWIEAVRRAVRSRASSNK